MSHMRMVPLPTGRQPASAGGFSGGDAQGLSPGHEQFSAKEAHLNRIRENQRRCRKRRKEYLEEMEEKIRQYQLKEVRVSVEMQAAARKVAEENRRLLEGQEDARRHADENRHLRKERDLLREENTQLRALLRRYGINDDCIFTSVATDNAVTLRQASPRTTPPSGSSTIQHLERLLQPQKLTSLEPCESFIPQPSHGGSTRSAGTDMSLQNREAPVSGSSSLWMGGMSDPLLAAGAPQEGGYQPALDHNGTALSRVDAAMVLKHLASTGPDVRSSTTTAGLASSTPSTGPLFYDSLHLIPSYPGEFPYYPVRQRLSGDSPTRSSTASSNNYLQAPRAENNCASATSMISVMTGLAPDHVRRELGCPPGADDCHVDNERYHNAVSRCAAMTATGM